MTSFITLSLVLFAICCYATAASFDLIKQEISRLNLIKMSPPVALNRLRKLKRCHALVCDTVDEIDDCFGPTLLLSISYFLIRFINSFVRQFSDCFFPGFDLQTAISLTTFIELFYWLSLICVPVNHLRFKVKMK